MTGSLFEGPSPPLPAHEDLAPGAVLLRGRALAAMPDLLAGIATVTAVAPFRHMHTPGGRRMSVAMSNCGDAGWVTDRRGYRYSRDDPGSGRPWPAMPAGFAALARDAAQAAGYPGFRPDSCLINRYVPGAKMALHQDRDEADFNDPIVSVSLGLPVTFQFGGLARRDPVTRHRLQHGDVVVWGGPSRLSYHGVLTLRGGEHPDLGRARINLTFRRAGAAG